MPPVRKDTKLIAPRCHTLRVATGEEKTFYVLRIPQQCVQHAHASASMASAPWPKSRQSAALGPPRRGVGITRKNGPHFDFAALLAPRFVA